MIKLKRMKGEVMILKAKDVIKKFDTISKLIDNKSITNVSLKYKLLTLLHNLEPHKDNISKLRDELVKKYGNEQEDGSYVLKESDENFKNYLEETANLLNTEIEIFDYPKITFSEIVNKIPNEDLLSLYEFIINGD